ncbi:alpha/beta hydrolase [Fictibacillus sp. KIGAM418]|uniref:Alpha/beta hydrolase n=1 Tax=Fictibacillus marinisediminis TaxID=2878389 RepID=A0A9X1XF07_9BACL|nr:alpha/beta hydrolase [Fictibacillus marinisediminis]MCK6259461.1 alpha/beta hydrolase [Fictibacillus marinisediminis]
MANERFVELENQGKLAGILHIPEGLQSACPLVIYCPGKNGERYEVHRLAVKFARQLAEQGIATLRFDYYGMGLSDGFYHDMTTTTKVSNIEMAYRYAKTLEFVDQKKVAYLGFSDGARMALMAANRTNVTNLLIWSPLFNEYGGNYPNAKKPRFIRHKTQPNKLVMPWAGLWNSLDFYKDLQGMDILHELNQYVGNSLLVFGGNDPLVEEEKEYLDTSNIPLYQNADVHRTHTIAGAGHLFTSESLEHQLMGVSGAWLREHLMHL